jgi:predicted nucleic acid-binding protein
LIAADSSSLIAYFEGVIADDTNAIDEAFTALEFVMPPPVLVELMGKTASRSAYDEIARGVALLPITPGYWARARESRSLILSKGLKARGIDALIAQCCIDADVPLIARDTDFRHFADWCGLKAILAR